MVGICQTTADNVESDSPGGIIGKSYKSISAPKRPQSLARNNRVQERGRRWMLPEPEALPQWALTGRYVRESFKRRHLIAFGVCHLKAWRWCQAGPVVNQRHICMAANLNAKWATSKHTHTHFWTTVRPSGLFDQRLNPPSSGRSWLLARIYPNRGYSGVQNHQR